jgi:hypothetical protein
MARGFLDIQIGGVEFATINEVVSREPLKSTAQFMEIMGYGATDKVIVALGNLAVQGGLTMTKDHVTPEDAEAWYQTAAATFTGVNNVLFTKQCFDGTIVAWEHANVKVIVTVEEPMNLTTTTHLEFEGAPAQLQP